MTMLPNAAIETSGLLTRLRAANEAVAAWLATPSDAGWEALRRAIAAMDAPAAKFASWPGPGDVAREADVYRRQLLALQGRLLEWQDGLRRRQARLQQGQARLEGLRAWKDALENTTA